MCGGAGHGGTGQPQVLGSIPACAGEPALRRSRSDSGRVDPRVCGGAPELFCVIVALLGRSPRVRGSLDVVDQRVKLSGSIPACAGEPAGCQSQLLGIRVDPRVCGGASAASLKGNRPVGRSPRVRGSRYLGAYLCRPSRSIPACAGEPQARRGPRSNVRVDPRVCGGAPGSSRTSK